MAYVTRGIGKGVVLVNNGFRYHRNWSSRSVLSWRCFRQECRAFVKTNVFDIEDPDARIRILEVCMHSLLVHLSIMYSTRCA
jgi:hypothetical protein